MEHLIEAERLVDFLNTFDGRRPDRREPPGAPDDSLTTPASLEDWLVAHGLDGRDASPGTLDLARTLRAALRASLVRGAAGAPIDELNDVSGRLPLVVRFDASGRPGPAPVRSGADGGLAQVLADTLALAESGDWDRLKACAAPDCRWVFVDRSRPNSGRWCSALACGNRDKTRRYRRRARRGPESAVVG
jgi:predicted RNA-binding Zn ribbon-like protein